MLNLDKPLEGVDYEILQAPPSEDGKPDYSIVLFKILSKQWKGFIVLASGVKLDGINNKLSFSYHATDLNGQLVASTEQLSTFVAEVMEDIIRTQIANGGIEFHGQDTGN